MHNIFKTELRNCASNPNFKNKLPLTTKNRNKKIIINNLLSRKDLNKKILNNSLNKKLLSGSYLNFMIQEKLAYADVDKIIDIIAALVMTLIIVFSLIRGKNHKKQDQVDDTISEGDGENLEDDNSTSV